MAEGTIDLPVIGETKKQWVYVGGAAAAGVLAYAYWRNSVQEAAAAGAPPPAESIGTIGADIGSGTGGYVDNPPIASDTTVGQPIATNSAWFQAAVDYLEARGIDSGAASKALGDFLDHRPLNAADQGYVRIAMGAVGNPPQGGPWNIITDTSMGAPTGLIARGVFENSFTLMWNAQNNAKSYNVYEGDKLLKNTSNTQLHISGRKAGTKYGPFSVAAVSAAGTEGARSMGYSVTTYGTPPIRGTIAITSRTPQKLHTLEALRNEVTIGWDDMKGAAGFDIYRDGKKVATRMGTYYHDLKLKSNRTYKYYVVAFDSEGKKSKRSATLSVKTKK